jgi:hypothetical protein
MPNRHQQVHARLAAKADAARQQLAQDEAAINARTDWTRDQKRAALVNARDRMAVAILNIRQERSDAYKAELQQVRRRIYGFDEPQSEMMRLSFRDAVGRAHAIASGDEAMRAMELALASGDSQMIRALNWVGEQRSWGPDVQAAWAGADPRVDELMHEYNELEGLANSTVQLLEDSKDLSTEDPAEMNLVPGTTGEGGGAPTLAG